MAAVRTDAIGYIVVEYNQASGQPGIPTGADLYWSAEEAEDYAEFEREDTRSRGRGERYKVAKVVLVDEDDD
jgi:hypothetical protein